MHLLNIILFCCRIILLSHHVALPRVQPAEAGCGMQPLSLLFSQYICIELRRFGSVFAPDPILHISPGPVRTM